MIGNKINKIIIWISVLLVILAILYFIFLSKFTLYRRLHFDIPEDVDVVEIDRNINVKTLFRIENENLSLKFELNDEETEKFIKQLEDEGYYTYSSATKKVPHPENTVDGWDLDYDKLEMLYTKDFTRNKIFVSRCHVRVFITESVDGVRQIYVDYTG